MSAKSESIVKSLLESIQSPSKETQPYDTSATVTRVEDDTVFVHIPGGVAETPCSKTISCKVGDTVQVRVGGGKAWLVGNASAPPTDDTTANTAIRRTNQLGDSLTKLQKIAGNTDQYFWHVETGEDTGSHITEIPKERFLEAPALGGGNLLLRSNGIAIRDGLNELATFSSSAIQFNQPGTSTVVATIGTSGLYIQKGVIKLGNKTSASDTTNSGTYIDANGNMATSNIKAHGGTIGAFIIDSTSLNVYATASGIGTSSNGLYRAIMHGSPGTNGGNIAFGVASRASTSDSWTWNTYMTYAGYFYSKNANIQGTITASSGTIGPWVLSTSGLYYPDLTTQNAIITGTWAKFGNGTGYVRIGHLGNAWGMDSSDDYALTIGNGVTWLVLGVNGSWLRPDESGSYNLGTSDYKWKNVYATNGTIQTSDAKDKDILCELDDTLAMNLILNAKPIEYMWKDGDHRRTRMGFIAQEVVEECKKMNKNLALFTASYKVNPELGDDDPNMIRDYFGEDVNDEELTWGLVYSELIAPLVKVVQIQHDNIQTLTSRISELEVRLNG